MMYLGDFAASAVVRLPWYTTAVDGSSITRATDGSIRVYKNNSTTQRTSSAGITDSEDFDSLTGVHFLNIDTGDNTDAGFYAAGNDYWVVLVAATIDSKVVNAVLGHFSIQNRYAGAALDAAAIRTALGLASANLDTQLGAIDDYIDTEVAAIVSAIAALPTTAAIADKLLGRNLAGGSDGGRMVKDALRALRNKVTDVAGALTVYAEDDSTTAWSATTTRDGAAGALTAVDPA